MTIYRRLTFIVASVHDEEPAEIMDAVLTVMGANDERWIGGTGILVLDFDETVVTLSEIETPVPLAAQSEVFEFPDTFSSTKDDDPDPFA